MQKIKKKYMKKFQRVKSNNMLMMKRYSILSMHIQKNNRLVPISMSEFFVLLQDMHISFHSYFFKFLKTLRSMIAEI